LSKVGAHEKKIYEQDAQIRGSSNASGFKGSSYNIKWGLVITWLNGYTVIGLSGRRQLVGGLPTNVGKALGEASEVGLMSAPAPSTHGYNHNQPMPCTSNMQHTW
jgi:hypothetical protein